jgi:glycosyltransferase involved in cell wall biosynthesis
VGRGVLVRVLCVIDCLGSGGAQRQMVNLARGLAQRKHQVELFVYYPQHDHFAPLLQEAGIAVHSRTKRARFSLAPARELRRLIKERRFEAVTAFLATPSLYAEIAHLATPRVPLVVSERFMYTGDSLRPATWLLQQAHRLASHITVNSHHQRERMERVFPWMRGRLTTIYNGVDLARFAPREDLRGPADRLRFLVLSSVVPKKNALGLARALAQYRDQYGGTGMVRWVGKVSSDPVAQNEYTQVNRLLSELRLHDQWQWLGERQDIPEQLCSHDALIHPSFYEGLPNAICEALACGRPVLASGVGDHARLVQEGTTGFLFDPKRPESLAHTLHRFQLLSAQERVRMGHRARLYAERELSVDTFSKRYEELFARLAP